MKSVPCDLMTVCRVSESEDAEGQSRSGDGAGGRADGSPEGREDEEFGPGETAAGLQRGQRQDAAGYTSKRVRRPPAPLFSHSSLALRTAGLLRTELQRLDF